MMSSRLLGGIFSLLLSLAAAELALGLGTSVSAGSEKQAQASQTASQATQDQSHDATTPEETPKKKLDVVSQKTVKTPAVADLKMDQSERSMPQSRGTAEDRTSRASARAKGDLTFDDLKFDIEKGGDFERTMLTEEIEMLHKKDVRIRGFILPASVFRLTGFTEFVLVRDNMECCFGPGAALYDCIIVHMAKGKSADFSTRPVMVRGKFEIREFQYPDSDQHYAIYFMTATEVK